MQILFSNNDLLDVIHPMKTLSQSPSLTTVAGDQ